MLNYFLNLSVLQTESLNKSFAFGLTSVSQNIFQWVFTAYYDSKKLWRRIKKIFN